MNQVNRKTPDELISKTQKQPLSARVKVETYEALKNIAKQTGASISDLTAGILEDYVQWYLEEGKKRGKRHGKK